MGEDRTKLEREVEASRERLKERQQEAEETVEGAERLAERAKELEANEERLRRAMHEPTGPLLPQPEPEKPAD